MIAGDPYDSLPTLPHENFRRSKAEWLDADGHLDPEKHKPDKMLQLGHYLVSREAILGHGEGGTVYLGWHQPTGIYVAVKTSSMKPGQEEQYLEYASLKALGRLYAAYRSPPYTDEYRRGKASYYLVTAYIDGEMPGSYYHPWVKTECVENVLTYPQGIGPVIAYVQSFIDELVYAAQKGVDHYDNNQSNFIVSQRAQKFVQIDFDGEGTYAKTPWKFKPNLLSKVNMEFHSWYVLCLLGIGEHIDFHEWRKKGLGCPSAGDDVARDILDFAKQIASKKTTLQNIFDAFQPLKKKYGTAAAAQ